MPAAKDKPGTAATKVAGIFHQEQEQVQPSTVAACCSLPQVESPQAAAKAAQESDEDEEDGSSSKMLHDGDWTRICDRIVLSQEDDEPPPRQASQCKGTAQVAQGDPW